MLSDDTFRARLQQTIASLKAWTGFVADVARIDEQQTGSAWRLALEPKVASGCPVEIVLRGDQKLDITIGPETYEDHPLASLDHIQPLLEAVVDGRVVTRTERSAATGVVRGVTTVVTFSDGRVVEMSRSATGAATDPAQEAEKRDRHYLPYRR